MVAVSAAAHLLVLALVGFSAPKLAFKALPPEPAIQVWLTPDLTPAVHRPKPPPAAVARPSPPHPARPPPARPLTTPPRPQQSAPQLARPAPVQPPAAGPPSGGRTGAPSAAGAGPSGGSVEGALRTSVGCDYDQLPRLTPAEREKCSQHFGEDARRAPAFTGVDPLKRGRFDAQAAADERRRAARTGPLQQPIESCGAFGCLPDTAISHTTPH